MDPPSELEKENAALLAERASLRRKVRALENKNAVLQAREAELERWLAETAPEQAATTGDDQPRAKGQPGPDVCD